MKWMVAASTQLAAVVLEEASMQEEYGLGGGGFWPREDVLMGN